MMKKPQDTFNSMVSNMKEMFSIPKVAGEGLQQKAEAVAGVWMRKGMDLMQDCKTEGEKFTEAK